MSAVSSVPANAIEVRGVRKEYDLFASPLRRFLALLLRTRRDAEHFVALDGVDLDVGRGETIGILGRNGAGKSTLLQLIAGVLTPTSGRIAVHGRVAAMLELGAGFHPEYTGRENIRLAASLYGVARSEIDARFDEIAAFADIGQHIDLPMRTYSSGMYVRLAFAVHTAIDPDVLIIDEALAVGDAAFQAKCYRRLRELKDKGTSILLVSHDVQSIRLFCDRAVWIDRGRVRMQGAPEQVTSLYLQDLHGGESGETRAGAEPSIAHAPPATAGDAFARDCDLSDGGAPAGALRWGQGGAGSLSAEVASPGGSNPGAAVHGEPLRIGVTLRLDPPAASPVSAWPSPFVTASRSTSCANRRPRGTWTCLPAAATSRSAWSSTSTTSSRPTSTRSRSRSSATSTAIPSTSISSKASSGSRSSRTSTSTRWCGRAFA